MLPVAVDAVFDKDDQMDISDASDAPAPVEDPLAHLARPALLPSLRPPLRREKPVLVALVSRLLLTYVFISIFF